MYSCIYEGQVTHRRREPVTHQFQYRLFMVYLDLDELPRLVGRGRLISDRGRSCRAFLRSDHLFGADRPLSTEVREFVQQQTGCVARGPIRLLTQLRYLGHYFSPLNLYYLFDELQRRVEYVVAEVNNTPWNERHCYVLWDGNRTSASPTLDFAHAKQFHVSPFMGMPMQYRWRLTEPGNELMVRLANVEDSRTLFDAGMALRRRELSQTQLRRMTARYPLMTAQIVAAIYYQAWRLWWKRCPLYTHPKNLTQGVTASRSRRPHQRRTASETVH